MLENIAGQKFECELKKVFYVCLNILRRLFNGNFLIICGDLLSFWEFYWKIINIFNSLDTVYFFTRYLNCFLKIKNFYVCDETA